MFDNIAFNVVIGLVFIYLLYSLFTTILSEIIVTWIGLRSRILRLSIEKMLNNGQTYLTKNKKYILWWRFLQQFFLKEFPDFKKSFAGQFYDWPSIKYLSNKGGEPKSFFSLTKPSYISNNQFADSLIQLLKSKGSGSSEMEKVNFALLFNTHDIHPDSLTNMQALAESAGQDIEVFKKKLMDWFDETQSRATGWYKRKLQLILFWLGFAIAFCFNIDSISITRILANDKDARKQFIAMSVALASDSAKYSSYLHQKKDTLFQNNTIDSSYALISEDINKANLVLGLGWSVNNSKSDSITIRKSTDSNLYNTLLISGPKLRLLEDSITKVKARQALGNQEVYLLEKSLSKLSYDSSIVATFSKKETDVKTKDIMASKMSLLKNSIDSSYQHLMLKKLQHSGDSVQYVLLTHEIGEIRNSLKDSMPSNISNIQSIIIPQNKNDEITIYGFRKLSLLETAGYFIKKLNPTTLNFWGLVITALMLSLGAPFWFDLLKKLVSLRGSGIKPEELTIQEKNTKPVTLQGNNTTKAEGEPAQTEIISGNLVKSILKHFSEDINRIPGVNTLFSYIDKVTGLENIQINVDNDFTYDEISSRYATLKIDTRSINPKIVITGNPTIQTGEIGMISNKSGYNGVGSLGCFLRKKGEDAVHLLSCWHVVKGNTDYTVSDTSIEIQNESGTPIAMRWAGGIHGAYDYGLARCISDWHENFNSLLKQKLGIMTGFKSRPVSCKDYEEQTSVRFYDCNKGTVTSGNLIAECKEISVKYPDRTRILNDVLVISSNDNKSISQKGHSGSILFDADNYAIGMIFCADKNYTYAIKLSNILSVHSDMVLIG